MKAHHPDTQVFLARIEGFQIGKNGTVHSVTFEFPPFKEVDNHTIGMSRALVYVEEIQSALTTEGYLIPQDEYVVIELRERKTNGIDDWHWELVSIHQLVEHWRSGI